MPAGTRTVAGTVALEPLADSVTVVPFAGAGPLSVTVAVEVDPPTTAFGFKVKAVTAGAVTVRVALWVVVPVPVLAEIDGVVLLPTATVVIVNVAVFAPALIATGLVTVADGSLEVTVTLVPPVGAGPLSVTVAVEEAPPTTDVGLRTSVVTVGARTVMLPVFEPPLGIDAVMTTAWFAETAVVVIGKPTTVVFAATVAVAGTVTAGLLDERLTTCPPVPATTAS